MLHGATMLEHGGRLRRAAAHYGIPLADWLDLSTGINPLGWPVPPLPASCWQRLPEDDDELVAVAATAYGHPAPLPLPGSQAAIQSLPSLLPPGPVAVLAPTYAEHPHAFAVAGRTPQRFAAAELEQVAQTAQVVVVVNPNNPDGEVFARERLLAAAATLATHGGWLVVDEAFGDATPELSLAGCDPCSVGLPGNVVVLRSLGKFYGLAGARVGFALAPAALRTVLAERIGPWPVAGPARLVAAGALADGDWQAATRLRLAEDSRRLADLLAPFGAVRRNALFCWLPLPDAARLHAALARRAVLTRLFEDTPRGLRFGLPGSEEEWTRLAAALEEVQQESVP